MEWAKIVPKALDDFVIIIQGNINASGALRGHEPQRTHSTEGRDWL